MSAGQHIQPMQLKMFMTPNEIKAMAPNPAELERVYNSQPDSGSGGYYSSRTEKPDEMWERKAEEASDTGLTGELAEEGVQRPVNLTHEVHGDPLGRGPWLGNGYHRVAGMADVGRGDNLIPVTHHRTWNETWRKAQEDWNY